MPFGKYKDMDDCISKNKDAEDPGAYCAQIHKDITGKWPSEAMQRDWDLCISENKDKADPETHCAEVLGIPVIHTGFEKESVTATTILPDGSKFVVNDVETKRHPDFDRIWRQFMTHVKPEGEARQRYVDWVHALNLDETKPYGQSMREQFSWVKKHVDFQLWKEDSHAKFWRVDAGFPLESMNQNVYLEDELYRSARTLKHTNVNLNHKFSLPTVDIVAAEYEDGVVEAVLRVPKGLRCPTCNNGKSLNDLIESNGIVNVSLEAVCEYNSETTGACEGMTFTGLALLTKNVLPGIPLTRMMPLEQIMVEALRVDETKSNRRKRKVKKIKMEVLEQDEPPQPRSDAERAKAHFNISDEDWNKLSDEEKQAYIDKLPERGSAEQVTTVEPDEHGQCPDGKRLNAVGKCVDTEECGEDSHWDVNANDGTGGCVPNSAPKPETPETQVGTPAAPKEDVLTDAPTEQPVAGEQPPILKPTLPTTAPPSGEPAPEAPATLPDETPEGELDPKPEHDCPPDHVYDYDANQCVPVTPLTKQDAVRIIRSAAVKLHQTNEALWRLSGSSKASQRRLAKETSANSKLLGQIQALKEQGVKLERQRDEANREFHNQEVKANQWYKKYESAVAMREEYKEQAELWKESNDKLSKKYNDALGTNLELSQKLTQAHEDYLKVASKTERLEGQLNKAKSISKKIYKLRV